MASAPLIVRADWMFGRRADLLWLVGGVVPSVVLLGLHLALRVDVVWLWWTWILVLDGPHVFATLSRTYLDADERVTRRRLLLGSFAWFAVGPAFFAMSATLGTRLPLALFFAFTGLWAYWHVVRQHYGVVMLYKRKNGDVDPVDAWIDGAAIYVGQIAPFVAFALTHPEARAMLGLKTTGAATNAIATGCWIAFGLAIAALVLRQLQRLRDGTGVNLPKLCTLAAVLALAGVLFSPPVASRLPFLLFFVLVTAFHNVQYHAIVWFYHQNRNKNAHTEGLAAKIGRSFALYAVAGIAFTALYRGLGCGLGAHPGCASFAPALDLPGKLRPTDLPQAVMWGFALHHYYLDQHIWRPSRDARLRRDLALPSEPVAVGA